jgi:hypothetical protein
MAAGSGCPGGPGNSIVVVIIRCSSRWRITRSISRGCDISVIRVCAAALGCCSYCASFTPLGSAGDCLAAGGLTPGSNCRTCSLTTAPPSTGVKRQISPTSLVSPPTSSHGTQKL